MGVQHINTRLKNKIDYLAEWQDSSLVLLNGEIALVRVDTGNTITNPITGQDEPEFDILMKVGDGEHTFGSLPWLSAKAADVYDWAKEQTAGAVDVVVTTTAETNKERTLSEWIAKAVNATIANAQAIANKANTADVYSKTAADTAISTAISTELGKLDHASSGSGNFVTNVTQTDGKVTVTKGNITASNLPSGISSDKISVGSKTLTKELTDISQTLSNKANTADVYSKSDANTAISTAISTELAKLDHDSSGSGNYVTNVTQVDGKVTVTKGNLPGADSTTPGIVKLGAAGGAATYNSVFGEGGLQDSVTAQGELISQLTSAISGGTHFRGIAAEVPTGSTYKIDSTSKDAAEGDIVIFGEKEYIYTGSGTGRGWKELGDLSRVTTLETWRGKLNKSDSVETNKFVTNVSIATDGTVTIGKARPTAANISYGTNSDVKTALDNLGSTKANSADVYTKGQTDTAITTALDALDLSAPAATNIASSNPIAFIDTISQSNGQVSATKKTIRAATISVSGIVQLSSSTDSTSQTLAATPKAVKTAYDKAKTAEETATGIGTRLGTVESNYVRFADDKLYVGASGADVIIFDCGGATETILPDASAMTYNMRMTTPAVSSGSDGVFEPDGNASDLTGVEINGETVPPENYTAE